jgi:hypothetical protein
VSRVNIVTSNNEKKKNLEDKDGEQTSDIIFIHGDNTIKASEWKTQSLEYQDYKKMYSSKFKMEEDEKHAEDSD